MDLEHVERQLREELEERVGRRLSDDEWETFKRIRPAGAQTVASQWRRREKAAFVAAPVAALAGVGMLLRWDFVFSPSVRIPLGICILLIALAVVGVWLRAFFSPPFGIWDQLGWLFWGFFFGVFLLAPFSAAGVALLFQDRDYLTSTQEWAGEEGKPATSIGVGLILAGVLLAWLGRPSRFWRR